MVIPALIAAGASLFGNMLGANSAQKAQESANQTNIQEAERNRLFQSDMWNKEAQFNEAEASKNRSFQEIMFRRQSTFNSSEAQKQRDYESIMSNSAYQRATEDMKKAGINPMLAYMQGGASTPSGSTASVSAPSGSQASIGGVSGAQARVEASPHGKMIADAVNQSISSGLDAVRVKKELSQLDSVIKLNEMYRKTEKTQQELNEANAKRAKADKELAEQTKLIRNTEYPAVATETELKRRQNLRDMKPGWMLYDKTVGKLLGALGVGTAAYKIKSSNKNPKDVKDVMYENPTSSW